MFVTRELVVDAEFGAARARLKQIARAADGDGLAGFARTAYEEALAHLTRDDAYQLTSVAVDVDITQLVDGKVGVHAMCPKNIFSAK